jgi:hypothetical protein
VQHIGGARYEREKDRYEGLYASRAWPASSLSQTEMDKGGGQMTMHNVHDIALIHFVQIGEFVKDLKRNNLDR